MNANILVNSYKIYRFSCEFQCKLFLFSSLFNEHQYWRKLGVPGPTPNILFGNTLQALKGGAIKFDQDAFAKYGKFYGYAAKIVAKQMLSQQYFRLYIFDSHAFSTMDLEMLKSIFIKNFRNFQNRFVCVRI